MSGEEKTIVIRRDLADDRRAALVKELRRLRDRLSEIEGELTLALGSSRLPGTAERFDRANAALTVIALNLADRTNERTD